MNVAVSLIGLVIAVVCAVVCHRIATTKGRSPVLWAVLGFLFPLIALIVIALLPSKRASAY
jgi:uncharacterized membrane protein YoaK (UPF0700 family)